MKLQAVLSQGGYVYLTGTFLIHTADLPESYITSEQRSQGPTLHFVLHFTAKASQKAPHTAWPNNRGQVY